MKQNYKDHLAAFVRFQSVSTDAQFIPEMERTANWLDNLLGSGGFTVERWQSQTTHPVVFAQYDLPYEAPTLLIYGHYDVQPADATQWKSDPFELTERKKRLFARGAADNKGQILIHLLTALQLARQGKLAYNLRFLIEGDEERGSPGLSELLEENRNKLACDQIIISDGSVLEDRPLLSLSLRGVANLTLSLQTHDQDLHAGLYGAATTPNAAQLLSQLMGRLFDKDGFVTVPGFYEGTSPAAGQENPYGLLPSLEISTLNSGYLGEGYANIIPGSAEAKLNLRIAPGQDAVKAAHRLMDFLREKSPSEAKLTITITEIEPPVSMPQDHPTLLRVKRYLHEAWQVSPALEHCGGSIPIVAHLAKLTGNPPVLANLANPDCQMHGADENITWDCVEKGLRFSHAYLSRQLPLHFH